MEKVRWAMRDRVVTKCNMLFPVQGISFPLSTHTISLVLIQVCPRLPERRPKFRASRRSSQVQIHQPFTLMRVLQTRINLGHVHRLLLLLLWLGADGERREITRRERLWRLLMRGWREWLLLEGLLRVLDGPHGGLGDHWSVDRWDLHVPRAAGCVCRMSRGGCGMLLRREGHNRPRIHMRPRTESIQRRIHFLHGPRRLL